MGTRTNQRMGAPVHQRRPASCGSKGRGGVWRADLPNGTERDGQLPPWTEPDNKQHTRLVPPPPPPLLCFSPSSPRSLVVSLAPSPGLLLEPSQSPHPPPAPAPAPLPLSRAHLSSLFLSPPTPSFSVSLRHLFGGSFAGGEPTRNKSATDTPKSSNPLWGGVISTVP